ncbi:MAG: hypothetical protein IT303_08545 [Dehalococcoidia bacterium]|nr:hypothetical protein [Dehalococcoidia bacterium]
MNPIARRTAAGLLAASLPWAGMFAVSTALAQQGGTERYEEPSGELVTVCHVEGGVSTTLTLPETDANLHLDTHAADTAGPCPTPGGGSGTRGQENPGGDGGTAPSGATSTPGSGAAPSGTPGTVPGAPQTGQGLTRQAESANYFSNAWVLGALLTVSGALGVAVFSRTGRQSTNRK